jgi:4'-phosphopantetheinyl transferase
VHRERFEARRIVRRVLLGDRLGVDPGALVVEEDGLGRPTIAGVSGLWWSTSHAQDVGVVAWSDAGPVGVDVAVWAQGQPADVLPVEQFLCAAEAQAFGAVPLEERAQASYAAWTAKEAVLKAMGVGLTVDPRRVDSGWRGDQFVPVPGGKGDQQIRCMGVVTEGRGSGTVCVAEGTGSGGAVEI